MKYEKVTVFAAASQKCSESYFEQSRQLGTFLGKTNRTIVYGGGNIGLMGELADASLKENGKIIGIIPEFLQELELGHKGIHELRVVPDLHEREKLLMTECDCIVALPGGIGTFSELLQSIVWKRLWQIDIDIFILNIDNYFDSLIKQLGTAIEGKFLREEFNSLWTVFSNVDDLIEHFEQDK